MIHSQLRTWKFHNKRVFVRADLNVPTDHGIIRNDFRLTSILPTLDYLFTNNNSVVLATHIGKPTSYDKNLSTEILIPWFKKHNYNVTFAPTVSEARSLSLQKKQLIILENLRFFKEEQAADPFFAKQLAQTADYYVNDAFGTIHRSDCSISLLPYEFSESRRTIGFLMEKELKILDSLLHHPKKPFVAILGGKKVAEKIPLIHNLLNSTDKVLLCPALCFTFLKALNQKVGASLVDDELIPTCKAILSDAQNCLVDIVMPHDYQIASHSIDGPLSYCTQHEFPSDAVGISIGPETVHVFTDEINTAQTIFFNGAMGFAQRPETRQSTYSLLRAMAQTKGITIIAGGDTIEATFSAGVADAIDHISTGGGAALAYLGGNQLPGLIPFEDY